MSAKVMSITIISSQKNTFINVFSLIENALANHTLHL